MTLHPVVMPVAGDEDTLSGEESAARLSRLARQALRVSADRSGVGLGEMLKDEEGRPCPDSGSYWSVSHKPFCVTAVVSGDRVGIDVEEIKPRTEPLFSRVAGDEEWGLADRSWDTFYRYWTAKEAALKAIGIGIGGLKACRVAALPDESHVVLDYRGDSLLVEHLRYGNHIVSVVKGANAIKWVVLDGETGDDDRRHTHEAPLPAREQ